MSLKNVVGTIIKINIVVFFLWMSVDAQFMMENFLVSYLSLLQGRIWTLVTSVFSHNMLFHLFFNMFVLYGFGKVLEGVLGSKNFLIFYLVAGMAGSLGHSLASSYLLHAPDLPALGASGAVSGVLVVFSLMFPRQLIFLFGLVPMPAIIATAFFVGSDIWGLVAQTRGSGIPIGHGAHLGGALIGFLYFFLFLRPKLKVNDKRMRIIDA